MSVRGSAPGPLESREGPAAGRHSRDTDVAEVFGVRDGRISSLDIYFDSAPFPK
jgi:hypothetical protein